MNYKAIDAGAEGLREVKVDPSWADLTVNAVKESTGDDYFDSYVDVVGSLDGYDLPVSKFTEYELLDGTMQNNITFKEKEQQLTEFHYGTKKIVFNVINVHLSVHMLQFVHLF